MKVYLRDFNNVLQSVKRKGDFEIVEDAREADVFVLWQDVRGDMAELCKINEKYLHKPVVVVQHGRAATNDYLAPNKFPMHATKFCCWGTKDYERLERAGYADRAVITGSPLVDFLGLDIQHEGKNVIFCPIITSHEEPDNILTYWELKKIEIKKSQEVLRKHYDDLRKEWNAWVVNPSSATESSIPYHNINRDWRLIAKLTDAHDTRLYMGDVVKTSPINKMHIQDGIKLLQVTDCLVGIEEGTYQLLAMALDVPIVMVDGFKYRDYGGIDYSTVEMVKTPAVRRVPIDELEKTIDEELANPATLSKERAKVVEEELWDKKTDPTENIIKVIREVCNG